MYVTQHAAARIATRFPPDLADIVERILDGQQGEAGVIAYVVGHVPEPAGPPLIDTRWWERSNGDLLVAVANEGSVETVFFRRAEQDMSARYFGARKVVDLRRWALV